MSYVHWGVNGAAYVGSEADFENKETASSSGNNDRDATHLDTTFNNFILMDNFTFIFVEFLKMESQTASQLDFYSKPGESPNFVTYQQVFGGVTFTFAIDNPNVEQYALLPTVKQFMFEKGWNAKEKLKNLKTDADIRIFANQRFHKAR